MIQISQDYVDGVSFISDIKIIEPFGYENGVQVERISNNCLKSSTRRILKALGMRKVSDGQMFDRDCEIWVAYPVNYYRYKMTHCLLRGYWKTVRFLYDNARIFKAIPPGECFSWRYFTPYVWYKQIFKRK